MSSQQLKSDPVRLMSAGPMSSNFRSATSPMAMASCTMTTPFVVSQLTLVHVDEVPVLHISPVTLHALAAAGQDVSGGR